MRVAISFSVVALGFALGAYELFQHHWFAGAGYASSAMMTAGLILFGASFVKDSFWGAGLAVATAACGFYGLLFESRGLDVDLDQARFEAGMALIQSPVPCTASINRADFQAAAHACFLQANRDKLDAVTEGAKQTYLPPQLDLADKVLGSATGQKPDLCKQLFFQAYQECPAAFASMNPGAIEKLRSTE